jgi:hypothetical protein
MATTVFKILLILLISAPFIAFFLVLYFQVYGFIKARNREDEMRAKKREAALKAALEAEGIPAPPVGSNAGRSSSAGRASGRRQNSVRSGSGRQR